MWINPEYRNELDELIAAREQIARYNSYRALKCMKGMILEKKHALCHPYPSKLEILDRLGYDPKQLSHIVRIHDFSKRFIEGESYEKCLIPKDKELLKECKHYAEESKEKYGDDRVIKRALINSCPKCGRTITVCCKDYVDFYTPKKEKSE